MDTHRIPQRRLPASPPPLYLNRVDPPSVAPPHLASVSTFSGHPRPRCTYPPSTVGRGLVAAAAVRELPEPDGVRRVILSLGVVGALQLRAAGLGEEPALRSGAFAGGGGGTEDDEDGDGDETHVGRLPSSSSEWMVEWDGFVAGGGSASVC